jgi:predicted nucleic acid-binding protein
MIVDASVLIAHLDERDAHNQAATQVLLAAAGDDLAASPITLAEVLVGPARGDRLVEAQAILDALSVREVALGTDAAPRLALLRAQTGLKLPDCCVLLAAADAQVPVVATFDERLTTVARRLGLDVRPA